MFRINAANGIPSGIIYDPLSDQGVADTDVSDWFDNPFQEAQSSAGNNVDAPSIISWMTQDSLDNWMEDEGIGFTEQFYEGNSTPLAESMYTPLSHHHQWRQLRDTGNVGGPQMAPVLENSMPSIVDDSHHQQIDPSASTTVSTSMEVAEASTVNATAAKCKVCGEISLEKIDAVSLCASHSAEWKTLVVDLGKKVKEARSRAKYSQNTMGEMLGMSKSWFGDREIGNKCFLLSELEKIAGVLKISLASFFKEMENFSSTETMSMLQGAVKTCDFCAQTSFWIEDTLSVCRAHHMQWKSLNKSHLGLKIRNAREALGMDEKKAATKIGVTVPAYVGWEHGVYHPQLKYLSQIAYVLNKPAAYFFEFSNQSESNLSVMTPEAQVSYPLSSVSYQDESQTSTTKIQGTKATAAKCAVCSKSTFEEFDSVPICEAHLSQWLNSACKNAGAEIKQARRQLPRKQRAQEAVAKQLGWTSQWICDRERGRTLVKLSDLVKVAKVLDVPLSNFFDK